MKQKVKMLCISLLAIGALTVLLIKKEAAEDTNSICVGIIQTASHPALDLVRENFQAELSRLMDKKVTYVLQNAEGSLVQAQTIAQNFHTHKKIRAIFAIATPAVQAIAKVEKEKPIFIAAVSNPELLGVANRSNVCGTTDRINTEAQAKLIHQFFPNLKNIAFLFNPSELNSTTCVAGAERALSQLGFNSTRIGVHSESEIASGAMMAANKNELILIPTDNLMASGIALITKEAMKKKCPVIVSDIHLVQHGALFAQGADYAALGKKTAALAFDVLLHKQNPQTVGIKDPEDLKIVVNRKIADELGVIIPKELISSIMFEE